MATFTVNEFIVKLENAKRELERARVVNAATVSADALALVKRRIQQERVDSTGKELGTYSQRKVPFWYFRNQRTLGNTANKVRELYKRYGYFASYADWKAVNNQTDPRINLTFTGRMMNGLKVVLAPSRRDVVAVFWQANNPVNQDIYERHLARFPLAFSLSDRERDIVLNAYTQRILQIINKVL